MRVLNIKGLPDRLHKKLTAVAKKERRSVAQQVIVILERVLDSDAGSGERKKHSIMELRGLGKEIWEGVDPARYVSELRDEWER